LCCDKQFKTSLYNILHIAENNININVTVVAVWYNFKGFRQISLAEIFGKHQHLVHAGNVNILGRRVHIINEKAKDELFAKKGQDYK
jgi:hypothetical protein